jgi:tetratricopeptide (TPR) repeat protein
MRRREATACAIGIAALAGLALGLPGAGQAQVPQAGRPLAAASAPARATAGASPHAAPAAAGYRLPPGADLGDVRAVARAAAERRDWATALPRWRALEVAAPDDIDLLIESARIYGFADRNAEAAARYRVILAKAPERRADLLLSLAWQTLWAGEPVRAAPLFEEVARNPSGHAGGGDGFDAWLGAAQARQNAGEHEAALAALEAAQARRPDDRSVARERARTLMHLERYAQAITAYDAAGAAMADDATADIELLIESARAHGFADRNAQAAQRYRAILARAPEQRADLQLPLAWQTLWAGEPAEAERLFAEVAARPADFAGAGDGFDAWRGIAESRQNAGDLEGSLAALHEARAMRPADRTIARRIAQTLAWLDRHDEAIAAFEQLLESDPDDRGSRYGLARARNVSGRHRQAVADYREAFARDRTRAEEVPNDARFDRARALRWAGYDDLAHQALADLPQAEAQWLRNWRTQRDSLRWLDASLEQASDRDELDTRINTASFGWRPDGATSVEVGTRLVDLAEPGRHARGEQLSLSLRRRFGAAESAIGSPADRGPVWASLTLAANRYGDWHPLSGVARLRWLPTDTLRIDGELGREIIETPVALGNRVHVDIAALGADWRWQPRSSLAATLAALRFDDGNLRTRINLRADHQLRANPKVVAGIEAMAFRSTDPSSNTRPGRGYWNPESYREARAYLAFGHEAWPWDFTLKLGVGTARETDGWGNRAKGEPNLWELSISYDLARQLKLRAWAGGSGGSMGVGSGGEGYWRRYVGLGVTGWF